MCLQHYSFYCLRSPEEASEYVRTLQAVLRSVAASDGNMEQVYRFFDGVPMRLANFVRDLCVVM
jgi:hypothetical protein